MCVCGNCLDPFTLPNGADGSIGAQGIQGFTGPIGVTGTPGTNGTVGSIWYTSAGIPGSGTGVDGDFYLNSINGDVYTKTLGSWNTPILNIIGAPGTAGVDGASFLTGAGVPSGGLGNNGDTYVDLTSPNLDIYSKSGGVWVDTGVDLKGATGAAGTNGTNGSDGNSLYQGVGVPTSGLGVDDDSYIDSASKNLYKKTAGAWILTGNLTTTLGVDDAFSASGVLPLSTGLALFPTVTQFAALACENEINDPSNAFGGNIWVCKTAGNYIFNATATVTSVVSLGNATDAYVEIKKNGVSIGLGALATPSGTGTFVTSPTITTTSVAFIVGDVVDFTFGVRVTGASNEVTGSSTSRNIACLSA